MNVIESFTRADGVAEKTDPRCCVCGQYRTPTNPGTPSVCEVCSQQRTTVPLKVDPCDPEWTEAHRRNYRTGMTPVWDAWKIGYLAATGGYPKSANPFLRAGESWDWPSYPISGGWETGWLNGQGKNAADVEREFSEWRSRR